MVIKNDTIACGKQHLFYILDLGAQSGSKGVQKAAQGCPWYSKCRPKVSKGCDNGAQKQQEARKQYHIYFFNVQKNEPKKHKLIIGNCIVASPASLTWPAQPGQLILASFASPSQQASPASKPASLEPFQVSEIRNPTRVPHFYTLFPNSDSSLKGSSRLLLSPHLMFYLDRGDLPHRCIHHYHLM